MTRMAVSAEAIGLPTAVLAPAFASANLTRSIDIGSLRARACSSSLFSASRTHLTNSSRCKVVSGPFCASCACSPATATSVRMRA